MFEESEQARKYLQDQLIRMGQEKKDALDRVTTLSKELIKKEKEIAKVSSTINLLNIDILKFKDENLTMSNKMSN